MSQYILWNWASCIMCFLITNNNTLKWKLMYIEMIYFLLASFFLFTGENIWDMKKIQVWSVKVSKNNSQEQE